MGGASQTFSYDRNRLLTVSTSGASAVASYNYDPFGRLDTVSVGGTVWERNTYDGFDHVISHQQINFVTGYDTTTYTYDPPRPQNLPDHRGRD